MAKVAEGLAFDENSCRSIISEAISRYTGQPGNTQANSWRAPGLFGLVQRRREILFKLGAADPVLPPEVGEFPRFQSDLPRQKYNELVSRLLENPFTIECAPASNLKKDRDRADVAERVLSFGVQRMQESSRVNWQRALAQGLVGQYAGILHWRIEPEIGVKTPDARYADDVDPEDADSYDETSTIPGADSTKGKYREKPTVVAERAKLAKARGPLPIHVEVVAPDACAPIWDESSLPGPGIVVHVKDVGLIDYNGALAKDGLRITATAGRGRNATVKLALEDYAPESEVSIERPAPNSPELPSITGWKQRVSVAYVWTRSEVYELVSPQLLASGQQTLIDSAGWTLVKGAPHGYGRCPFVWAYGDVNESEWDPALRWRPAIDGLYQMAPQYNYTRAMEMVTAQKLALQTVFMTQDPNAPPVMAGDEEGDSTVLPQDSGAAQVLPPGADLKSVGPTDISAGFVRSRELAGEEFEASAPPTGSTEITATTQPWTARLGQSQANAYPALLLKGVADALAEMFRSWVETFAKDTKEGGLGYGLYVPGTVKVDDKDVTDFSQAVGLEPAEWQGIWVDVKISDVSSAEQVTQQQLGLQLLNNPIPILTPEQYVGDWMGVEDATGHMRAVEAYTATMPWKPKLLQQELAKRWGPRVVTAAGGQLVGIDGNAMEPDAVLAQNGIRPANPNPTPQAPPGAGIAPPPSPNMPALPTLAGQGVAPMGGLA